MNEATLEVVEAKARSMSTDRVIEELERTDIREVRERVKEVIKDEHECPECENDLLFTSDDILYCPLGCFEAHVEL